MNTLREILDVAVREVFRQSESMITDSEVDKYVAYMLINSKMDTISSVMATGKNKKENWVCTQINEKLNGFGIGESCGDRELKFGTEYIMVKFSLLPDRHWLIIGCNDMCELTRVIEGQGRFDNSIAYDTEFAIIGGKVERYELKFNGGNLNEKWVSHDKTYRHENLEYVCWETIMPYRITYKRRNKSFEDKEYHDIAALKGGLLDLLERERDSIECVEVNESGRTYQVEELTKKSYESTGNYNGKVDYVREIQLYPSDENDYCDFNLEFEFYGEE